MQSNRGTVKLGSHSIAVVEIRTQKLGFDPKSRGCPMWSACLKLPGDLHSCYEDDKFHIGKFFVETPSGDLQEKFGEDIGAKDLSAIRKLEVLIRIPPINADRSFDWKTFDYVFDKVL